MKNKQCKQCNKTFQIYPEDIEFYRRINVPEPSLCVDCRAQRRLAFRNEWTYYSDICKKCGKNIVSQFNPKYNLNVYCEKCYWQDDWEGQDYGQDFDFNITFSEQFQELMLKVPKMAMIHTDSENSEYTHLCAQNKNCYMVVESSNNENCLYSYWLQKCVDCVDTCYSSDSQLTYESDNLVKCYNLQYCRNCESCLDSYFLANCKSCKNCYGCINLVSHQFCIFNKQKTEKEYFDYIKNIDFKDTAQMQSQKKKFEDFMLSQPKKYGEIYNSENSTGNYLQHTKNCQQVFHAYDAENCRYGEHIWRQAKDCQDVSTVGINAELVYDSINCALGVYNIKFCNQCWNSSADLAYCFYCGGLKKAFGCTGIKHGNNLILNKQYDEDVYEKMKEKIIAHMRTTGEWGEYINPKFALFGYNETIAQEIYPLTKEQAKINNFKWLDQNESISESSDQFSACQQCNKNFKIIAQEKEFYNIQNIATPSICPNCRHLARVKQHNPNFLWQRQCQKPDCHNNFLTTYSPERKEIIYCDECFNKEIY